MGVSTHVKLVRSNPPASKYTSSQVKNKVDNVFAIRDVVTKEFLAVC